jgi:hypothetical protein
MCGFICQNFELLGWVYLVLVEDISLCLKYANKIKLNMYSVWHNYMFILLFYYIIGY